MIFEVDFYACNLGSKNLKNTNKKRSEYFNDIISDLDEIENNLNTNKRKYRMGSNWLLSESKLNPFRKSNYETFKKTDGNIGNNFTSAIYFGQGGGLHKPKITLEGQFLKKPQPASIYYQKSMYIPVPMDRKSVSFFQ